MTEPVILVYGSDEYTRRDLDMGAIALSGHLVAAGAGRGTRIALMSSNRPEFVMAVLAIWRLGAAVVLISPAWRHAEVERALALTGVRLGIGDQPVLGDLVPMVDLDRSGTLVRDGVAAPAASPDPDADAVLVFSSGTTGMPKAVRHTHRSFGAAVTQWRQALDLGEADRIQVLTPPSHILGLLNIITVLDAGAWMRLEKRFDLNQMLMRIASDRITIEMAVAPMALALAAHPDLESYDLSSLRYIMWGATPVTRSVAETVTRRTGVGWIPAYGASEIPVIACNPVGHGTDGEARLDSVGRAVRGVEVRVVSLDTGEVLAPGESGEIQVRSPSVMSGYLPPEETHAAFSDGWYRTGDVGSVDADGWLRLTDRCKEMIKVNGFQVAPAEVESVLHGHPAISDCAVYGIPDEASGEAVMAAAAVSRPVSEDELLELVGASLATYKRPRRVVFVDEIPRLPSGKVLRRVLKENHGRPAYG